jgi:hypothetical protein
MKASYNVFLSTSETGVGGLKDGFSGKGYEDADGIEE